MKCVSGLFILVLTLSSCATNQAREAELLEPIVRVYTAEYDKVWRAVQKTLLQYPIRVNNIDAGLIETDEIKGLKVWNPVHKPKTKQPGLRYHLVITLVRGQQSTNEATSVQIEKFLSLSKSFFADTKRLPSDGLEEETLHYRIQRELTIEKALDTAYEQAQ